MQHILQDILKALNKEVRQFTGSIKAPTKYSLELVVNRAADECKDFTKRTFILALAKNMRGRRESHMNDNYVAYRKVIFIWNKFVVVTFYHTLLLFYLFEFLYLACALLFGHSCEFFLSMW
jgi:hypothetical protein